MLGVYDHPFVRGAAQPVLDLVKILDGLAEVVAGVLFDIALEWQRRCFQESKHAIHFLLRMASQLVVVQNKLWKVEVGHKGSQLSLLGLARLDASHKRGSLKAHGGQPSVALLQVPLSPVFKQPPSVQGRDRQLEGVASGHQDDSKYMFPDEFGEFAVVVHILQLGFEPNCYRPRTLPGVQQAHHPLPLCSASEVHQFFTFRDHIGMALQRRSQPTRTCSAREQNDKWPARFDDSPLLGVFGDRCVDVLEFSGQCSQAESGFIHPSAVCTDLFSHLWIDEMGNGLGEFIGCMFRDQQAVDAVFDLEWDTSMAGRDHRSSRRHGLNDHGGRPFFISVPRSHTGNQSEVGHFKPLADVIVINRAQEFHGVGRVKFVNQGFKFPVKGAVPGNFVSNVDARFSQCGHRLDSIGESLLFHQASNGQDPQGIIWWLWPISVGEIIWDSAKRMHHDFVFRCPKRLEAIGHHRIEPQEPHADFEQSVVDIPPLLQGVSGDVVAVERGDQRARNSADGLQHGRENAARTKLAVDDIKALRAPQRLHGLQQRKRKGVPTKPKRIQRFDRHAWCREQRHRHRFAAFERPRHARGAWSRLFDPEIAQLFVIVLIERVWWRFGRVDGDLMSESGHLPNLARDERLIQLREFGKEVRDLHFSRVSQESADAALSTRRVAA